MSGQAFLSNVLEFGRALRAVGIPAGPARLAELAEALAWIGVDDRQRFFHTARALLVSRHEDLALFETVFNSFWRHPDDHRPRRPRSTARRPAESARAFTIATYAAFKANKELEERDVLDRAGTFSDMEWLRHKRFAEMNPDELEEARRLLRTLDWRTAQRVTRRRAPHRSGPQIDVRRTLRRVSRLGMVPPELPRRRRVRKPRPLVLLADVSGSMEVYSKLVLQLFHTLMRTMPDVETFVFGTRLSRITSQLRLRNVDRALGETSHEVLDWAGGTRIGACLGDFNQEWSRRVLRRGAIVVVVSDGCDRGDPAELAGQMRRIRQRCHRIIWLNPHAGHHEYRPRAAGMAAALPYVDTFLPARDLASLTDFATALVDPRRVSARAERHPVLQQD